MDSDLPSAADVERHRRDWFIPASLSSSRTLNPIRAIVDQLRMPPANGGKQLIPLSIGDPTIFGNLSPPPTAIAELQRLCAEGKDNGYAPAHGTGTARSAIAQRFSRPCPDDPHSDTLVANRPLTADDVMLCSGASGALHIALDALCSPGDNILLPRPGFSLYATIAQYLNVECRYYDLLPLRGWECDLSAAGALVDARTRCILINNPSNPCGSNFSRTHLRAILAFAEAHRLPVVSDEIYGDMVFRGESFTPIASLSEVVPIIAVGGIAKQYVVPGWRVGWLLWHDRGGRLAAVKAGALKLTQLILGCSTLIQALLPALLLDTPRAYYEQLNLALETQSMFLHDEIARIPGLRPVKPQGAMYLMVGLVAGAWPAALSDDVKFANALLTEQMLFVLPGSCFQAPAFFRLVTVAPKHILEMAVARLRHFAAHHALPTATAAAAETSTDMQK